MEDPHNYERGLYDKFKVTRVSTGQEVEDFTFTLLPKTDPIARKVLLIYAKEVERMGFLLMADQLRQKVREAEESATIIKA
jgi:hypothetical protein